MRLAKDTPIGDIHRQFLQQPYKGFFELPVVTVFYTAKIFSTFKDVKYQVIVRVAS